MTKRRANRLVYYGKGTSIEKLSFPQQEGGGGMDSDSSTRYLRMMKAIKLNTNEKRIPFLPLCE